MNVSGRTELLKEAKAKYNSYNADNWKRAYFNKENGGYLLIDRERIKQSAINKQEKEKYNKEYDMCRTLADNGYKVEYLKITERSFDIYLNGIAADLKKTVGSVNIVKYAKHAIKEQGAQIVVFEFEKETTHIKEELKNLKAKGIKVKYYFSNNLNKIIDL
ncbi:MAG: hypothetical protein LBF08_00575 [Dysgonamonadaceae bacterium]|nr:hypothetical protein [Dysgonamonadaceae bacterium]